MALPADGTVWPPRDAAPVFDDMRQFAAWWTGTQANLGTTETQTSTANRGGLFRRLLNTFWHDRNSRPQESSRAPLHVPLASDIAQTSANLLYANAPTIESDHEATAQRLTEYLEDGLIDTLLAGAESGAALGGRYHRVTFDPAKERPFITTVDADAAIPVFRWGRLAEVTFWGTLKTEGMTVYRHLEHHELDADGNGLIAHALYQGTSDNLGRRIPLTDHPATAPLAEEIDENGYIIHGRTPGLNVVYFPNIRPQRKWRNSSSGKELGRSDFDSGILGLMDALDEVYTSWLRDIRVGQAKVLVSEDMLDTEAGGELFDHSKEVFAPLSGVLPSRDDNGLSIAQVQFALRVDEHAKTCEHLTKTIISQCGYSSATFGEHTADADVTATEIKAREKRSHTTRGRKLRLEQPNLEALLRKLITVDADIYNQPLNPDTVKVTFPPAVSETTAELVQSAAVIAAAQLATKQTLVSMIHPDWTTEQIAAEVAEIKAEGATLLNLDTWRPVTGEPESE